ncbi:hypothetical protein YPPY46_2723 [Yersinia pestis PY-46]|uniref:Uncharacterized protein n=1 Tax=Yersinia pestis biovar Orientalis str. IP275 TaxID=373665 RepID=A0AAV3BC01_YERPE|nr:hypothetical protein YpAngola_A2545 [Yersinia pestis Angola]EDR32113.1 hypothetical protein YPIP275_2693 [Yersinia pestis biovar Orientalis str. IP275]EDR38878.1 hypothetical protein YpF1991016_0760 [Yersinia pestis biovar Orientalis str. F1991016]EDR52326.1 hypothetical protein YpB42003004_1759 [Yersinia pestis biovar Antiqua str. B42003004]EDR55991.1 hypothetical protein YpMG051020_2716 [Yersinia pestis biovar Orientalis str. MG05-1020]EDR61057.1 hypothetical protein YpUG050454_4215 [Yers
MITGNPVASGGSAIGQRLVMEQEARESIIGKISYHLIK